MISRSKATLTLFLAVTALVPATLAAGAGPPEPVDPTIVPGVSIGGVSVGSTADEAAAAWGGEGACEANADLRICEYGSNRRGLAAFGLMNEEVAFASITAGLKGKRFEFSGPLLEFGTEKGDLGLGDKLKKVAKRYPDGKTKRGGTLVFKGDGLRMTFARDENGRIVQIALLPKP